MRLEPAKVGLRSANPTYGAFREAFSKEYAIDFCGIRFETTIGDDAPRLTQSQVDDYEKYKYQCVDRLHIPGTAPMKRSNILIINSHNIKMPDAQFKLLMELVVELKKGEGGWLTKNTDAGKYQFIDRLRKPIEGSLLKKDAKKFIENDGSKRYRISIHPDFVTFERGNLLKHTEPEVKALAKGLPKDGSLRT